MDIRRLVKLGVLLGICATVSVLGLVHWTDQTGRPSFPSLGVLAILLINGSTLSLALALTQFIEVRRARSRPVPQPAPLDLSVDYLARYSLSNRVTAVAMAGFFGLLTVFFVLRSVKVRTIVIAGLMLCWCVWFAVQMLITSLRFTPEGLEVTVPWQRRFSETYHDVRRIRIKHGTIAVAFLDGRSVKLHPGLGNHEVVIAYLLAYCRDSVLDEQVES
jgi:hypothetical protein